MGGTGTDGSIRESEDASKGTVAMREYISAPTKDKPYTYQAEARLQVISRPINESVPGYSST